MKIAERIVLVLLFFSLVGGAAWLYFSIQYEQAKVRDAVARGEFENPIATTSSTVENWRTIYPVTVPIMVGDVPVRASVADTLSSRIKGLSGTPFLPDDVVKLFAFGVAGPHSIWMKDMNYAIDILWATEDGEIVHIEESVSPETYPSSFSSPVPAWYVVETNAGFVEMHGITLGDKITLPTQ
jgi:uncharacterized membrane protein (UPF0127 family)